MSANLEGLTMDNLGRVSVTLPKQLADTVKCAAKQSHRSFSGQVAFFVESALREINKPKA